MFQLLGERVSIIGVARKASRADDESASNGNSNDDLYPKLIRVSGFPFTDALNFRGMQGIEIIFCLAVGAAPILTGQCCRK